jgi:sulfide:quinone oxidoreductase
MARVLILGGGFGGVVAAERLAHDLPVDHEITLVSETGRFVFYPALVRLAFDRAAEEDVTFDLRAAMLDRRVRFVETRVAHVNPLARRATLTGGDITGEIEYDFLIYALGRRLATERVRGFFEHAHHLLSVEAARKFGAAVANFKGGAAVVGQCPGARLEVPVYETAFALARYVKEKRLPAQIVVISPDNPARAPERMEVLRAVQPALEAHGIEVVPDFPITEVDERQVRSAPWRAIDYKLLMLVPPFEGASALSGTSLVDEEGYVKVDKRMRSTDARNFYAVGDAVALPGPKMAHMAVRQAEVAAENVLAEIAGRPATAEYVHEMSLVVDEGGAGTIHLREQVPPRGEAAVRRGRFWSWAKRAHADHWVSSRS